MGVLLHRGKLRLRALESTYNTLRTLCIYSSYLHKDLFVDDLYQKAYGLQSQSMGVAMMAMLFVISSE